jgi:membrane peptidoglycan carboxypeptidase
MAQQGKITREQADEAKKVDIIAQVQEPQSKYAGIRAPYFVWQQEANCRVSSCQAIRTAAAVKSWRLESHHYARYESTKHCG